MTKLNFLEDQFLQLQVSILVGKKQFHQIIVHDYFSCGFVH